jgi:peptidoglycan/LPS O-acetylase OafA/YrhL
MRTTEIPQNETGKPFIASLQAMRFLAAAMVLISHLFLEINGGRLGRGAKFYDPTHVRWDCGVDIFFVISGFIMYYIMRDRFNTGASISFLKNRFIRVVFLYWIFTTAFIAINILLPMAVKNNDISLMRVLTTYSFVAWPKFDGTFKPILGVGWTLNYEIFFYLCFALALAMPKARGLTFLGLSFSILAAIGLVINAARPHMPFYAFYTGPILLEFFYGILIAYAFVSGVRLGVLVRSSLIVLGFGALYVFVFLGVVENGNLRFIHAGLPAALIVAGGVLGTDLRTDTRLALLAVLGGDISYSLYLSHLFSMRVVTLVWQHLHLPNGLPFFLAAFVFALLGAYLSFRFVEKPVLKLLRREGSGRRGAAIKSPSPA